ncbi:MAG TPA: sigma-70 family RNA polymerase sigma factor [Candidatus Baltobacteraceae bacterium]|jgi:RNA polymerase sigma-70 factor (ECF subfamily)
MADRQEIAPAAIEAARAGRPGAADRLVAEAWPHAYRIAYGLLRDRDLAQDAAQEACAAIFTRISQLRTAEAFRVWLYRIVVREAARLERKRALSHVLGFAPASVDDIAVSTLRADLRSALGKLARLQRAVIVLRYYAGMNSTEIAAVLAIPAGSVRFHLVEARRALERLLDEPRSSSRFLEVARVV